MMQRFLGLTEEELVENEKMWREERDEPELETTQGQDLRGIGVTPADIESDIATGQELAQAEPGPEGLEPGAAMPGQPTAGGVNAPAGAPPIPAI
jgi:hypothetical protein